VRSGSSPATCEAALAHLGAELASYGGKALGGLPQHAPLDTEMLLDAVHQAALLISTTRVDLVSTQESDAPIAAREESGLA